MIKRYFVIPVALVFMCVQCTEEVQDSCVVNVIPQPVKFTKAAGCFTFSSRNIIWVQTGNEEQQVVADYFKEMVEVPTGLHFEISTYEGSVPPRRGIVFLQKDDPGYRLEGYRLNVMKNRVLISASEGNGLFYGVQSLRQLMPPGIESASVVEGINWTIPVLDITDYPRFPWRGMHLDVSRHFFPKEFIKRYIDMIAFHKMNVFHWHLVDDQGWRIEIKKYPKLTEIGAWRVEREGKAWNDRTPQQPGEKTAYGGFFTQEDIKEIVAYASDRYVTIVPEIEMPAHTTAALAAYPEFSCTGGPFKVPPGGVWPITDIFCAGKESTFTFLEDVLLEVMGLFR